MNAERGSVMGRGRLEAFSDGVMAIIITIMVLELKVPHGAGLDAIRPLLPGFLSYVLSFVYVGIYWNNHHHLLHASRRISGRVLWANLHLLFWLSLFPFATGWMGENQFARAPSALYGLVLLCAAVAYLLLQKAIIATDGESSVLRRAIGRDWKGKFSTACYVTGVLSTIWVPLVAQLLYVAVAIVWVVPDQRIEQALHEAAVIKENHS